MMHGLENIKLWHVVTHSKINTIKQSVMSHMIFNRNIYEDQLKKPSPKRNELVS
jgi:hypothetical protein